MPRHDLDLVSLAAGAAFVGTALAFLLESAADLSAEWTWPVLLILVGVVGLIGSRAGSARR